MSSVPPLAREAIDLARRGDTAGAIDAARRAVASHPDDYGLRLFIGLLHSRRLELDEALPHVRKAVSLSPADPVPRVELVRLLIGLGQLDEAEQELANVRIPGPEPLRLKAMILARRDRPEQAAPIFRQVVAADPRDHESWGNLGGCLLASGRPGLAAEAFARAIQLRPDVQKFREKWMEAQVDAGEGEQALEEARQFAAQNPGAVEPHVTIARLQELLHRPEEAVKTLQSALAAYPRHLPALTAFAGLLERQNRIDELADTIATIEQLEPDTVELQLLRARLAFRRRDFDRALQLAKAAPDGFDPGSRAELMGKIYDRMGDSESAFRAFQEMSRESDLSDRVIAQRAQALRQLIDRRAQLVSGEWFRGWSASSEKAVVREPAFLIGFPRSGTTLLDTFLMGHPQLCIAEERPMLQAVAQQLGEYERLAALDESELQSLRARYFESAADFVPELGSRLLIDKLPLGAIDTPLIHRLFPASKIIFALRHPCDVVLSCFITRFQPSPTLISFNTLEDSAKLYDRVMTFWTQCRAAMPLAVHTIKYEELVASPETNLRPLISFLGLDWNDDVLHHQKAAESRSFITTASYAQVIEPLYDRSIGRWKRYREQMKPVLPLLEPWAATFGYEM
jgi:tetratricopeptide (TPR) repeat protein